MHQSNERPEMSFDRSRHELEHLRFCCVNHETEKATLRAQLDNSDQQLTYYHGLCREQEATIEDLRSKLKAAEAENVALRDECDVRMSETVSRDTPLDLDRKERMAKATSRKRYRAPTVESVSDEESGSSEQITVTSDQQSDTTNHILEVFLTFVSVTDSRMNKRQAVYVRQQQSLRDVLGPHVFGRFPMDAMAFVHKAQQIRNVGQTAAQVSTLPTHTSSGRVS
jgi:predicted nuclease with TOPRIM domain